MLFYKVKNISKLFAKVMAAIKKCFTLLTVKAVCYSILIWQLIITSQLYFEYETVTRIEYYFSSDIPAVLFCMPRICSKQRSEQIIQSYNDNYNSGNYSNQNNAISIKCSYTSPYVNFQLQELENLLKSTLLDFDEKFLFRIDTVGWLYYLQFSGENVTLKAEGYNRAFRSASQNLTLPTGFKEFFSVKHKRCFLVNTFNKSYRAIEEAKKIKETKILSLALWDLFYPNDSATLGLYSCTDSPSRNQIPRVEIGLTDDNSHYDVKYHNLKIERLEAPYQAMCKKYSGKSQAECMTDCFFSDQKLQVIAAGQTMPVLEKGYFIPSQMFKKFADRNDSFVHETDVTFHSYAEWEGSYQKRKLECLPDCVATTYYLQPLSPTSKSFSPSYYWFGFFHDDNYDIYLKHSPLIDFMTFVGTLGGLGGMWFGFSFLDRLNNCFEWFFKFFYSKQNRVNPDKKSQQRNCLLRERFYLRKLEKSMNLKFGFLLVFVVLLTINSIVVYCLILWKN